MSFHFMGNQDFEQLCLVKLYSTAKSLLSASMPVEPSDKDLIVVLDPIRRAHAFKKSECSTLEIISFGPPVSII